MLNFFKDVDDVSIEAKIKEKKESSIGSLRLKGGHSLWKIDKETHLVSKVSEFKSIPLNIVKGGDTKRKTYSR